MRDEYDFSKGKRGAVTPVPQGKTRVTIRLDDDLLDWFRNEVDRAGGANYQTLINLALRDFVNRSREPLEKTLRRWSSNSRTREPWRPPGSLDWRIGRPPNAPGPHDLIVTFEPATPQETVRGD